MDINTLCDINIKNLSKFETNNMLFLFQIVKYCNENNIGNSEKVSKLFNIFLNNLSVCFENNNCIKYNLELNIYQGKILRFIFKPLILILGEEYWFDVPDNIHYKEATSLLNSLEANKDPRFEYKIMRTPSELTKIINNVGIENIRGLFMFQDVIADSYLNNMTLFEMKNYLTFLNTKIYLYPPLGITDIFSSKKYYRTLVDEIKFAALPKSKVYYFENYERNMEFRIQKKLYRVILDFWKEFDKVVVKKGYSYEAKQVQVFNKKTTYDEANASENPNKEKIIKNIIFKRLSKLNYKNFWGIESNAMTIEQGIDRYYIVQGFNKIVKNRNNEYRVFFLDGIPKYVSNSGWTANICIENKNTTPIQKAVIDFAVKLYSVYIPKIWKLRTKPILFRIDVSYAVDPIFQDEYSQYVEGFENKIRIYANEMEIDPTSFLYNEFKCENEFQYGIKYTGENIEIEMANLINKYIKSIK